MRLNQLDLGLWRATIAFIGLTVAATANTDLPPLPKTLEEGVAVLSTGVPSDKWKRIDDHTVSLQGLGRYATIDRTKCIFEWTADPGPESAPAQKSIFGDGPALAVQLALRTQYKFDEIEASKIREGQEPDSTEAGDYILEAPPGDRTKCSFFKSDPPICSSMIKVQHIFADDRMRQQAVEDALHAIYATLCKKPKP